MHNDSFGVHFSWALLYVMLATGIILVLAIIVTRTNVNVKIDEVRQVRLPFRVPIYVAVSVTAIH
ncbi:MAG: hypothetical protein ACSLEY_02525 [Candidatus Saccharimonadales bacterium]